MPYTQNQIMPACTVLERAAVVINSFPGNEGKEFIFELASKNWPSNEGTTYKTSSRIHNLLTMTQHGHLTPEKTCALFNAWENTPEHVTPAFLMGHLSDIETATAIAKQADPDVVREEKRTFWAKMAKDHRVMGF